MQSSSSFRQKVAPASASHDGKTFAEIHARATLSNLRPGHHYRRPIQSSTSTNKSHDATPALWDHAVAVDLFQKLRGGDAEAGDAASGNYSRLANKGLSSQALHLSLARFFGLVLSEQQSEIVLRKIRGGGGGGVCSQSEFIAMFRHLSETGTPYDTEQTRTRPRTWSEASSAFNVSSTTSDGEFTVKSAWGDDLEAHRPEADLQILLREEAALAEQMREHEESTTAAEVESSDDALQRRLNALGARKQDRAGAVDPESGYTPVPAHLVLPPRKC